MMLLRRLHKWVGLVLGVQLLLWAVSGTMMALLDHHEVAGEHTYRTPAMSEVVQPLPLAAVQAGLPGAEIVGFKLRPMLGGHVYEVKTSDGIRLVGPEGRPITVDAELAKTVAKAEYAGDGKVSSAVRLTEPTLEARGRPLPLWRVDFDDSKATTFYVAESTAQVVEHRTDTWRVWDFFWMLHIMDYSGRESFNHPLIITVATGIAWVALTGFTLLFVSFRRMDFEWVLDLGERLRRRKKR
ncbi:peptidase [Caulobacter sp. 17J65-9]|nr:peptidase [Caulobacter sp. 17J65-9]